MAPRRCLVQRYLLMLCYLFIFTITTEVSVSSTNINSSSAVPQKRSVVFSEYRGTSTSSFRTMVNTSFLSSSRRTSPQQLRDSFMNNHSDTDTPPIITMPTRQHVKHENIRHKRHKINRSSKYNSEETKLVGFLPTADYEPNLWPLKCIIGVLIFLWTGCAVGAVITVSLETT